MGIAARATGGALMAALVMTLSGCLSVAVETSVSNEGAFTGTSVMSFDRASAADFGVTDLSQAQTELGVPDTATENVAVEWSQTDDAYVQTVTFTDATTAQIEEATSDTTTQDGMTTSTSFGFPLVAKAEGDEMVVSLNQETVAAGAESSPGQAGDPQATARMAKMLFGDSAVDLSITMPGQINSIEGVIPTAAQRKGTEITVERSDQTVTVAAPFAALVALEDTSKGLPGLVVRSANDPSPTPASTVEPTPAPATDSGSSSAVPLIVGAGALVAVVLVIAGLVMARRRGRDG